MTPQQVTLDVYRGDSYQWTFTLWKDEAGTNPYNLTGAVAKAEIRLAPGSPVLAALVCTVTQPNTIDVKLPATISSTLTGQSRWDLQLTFPDSTVKTVVAGTVTVTADVTDSTAP